MNRKAKLKRRIDLAYGRDPVDLVLKNCRVVNVFNHSIEEKNIAIDSGKIIGLGDYEGKKVLDLKGKFVVPGLIDSHVHISADTMVSASLPQSPERP